MSDLMLTQGAAFTDAELVARSRHGDEEAFTALADRHRTALNRALRALGGSPDLGVVALDVAAASFRRHGGPTHGVRPFLLLVLRDVVARDRAVTISHHGATDGRPGGHLPFVDGTAAEHADIAAEVARLSDRLQALLWHHHVEDDAAVVVGAMLGLAPSQVEPLAWATTCDLRTALVARREHDPELPTPCRAHLLRLKRGRCLAVPEAVRRHAHTCASCERLVGDLDAVEQDLPRVLARHVLADAGDRYRELR